MHRHRFESFQHAMLVIGDWDAFCKNRRANQALARGTPSESFSLAA